MSNPINIQSFLDSQVAILTVVDEVLNEWTGEGCLQFPTLMITVSSRLGWDNGSEEGLKQQRAKEPIIREYVRTHPVWYVTRGAHGGIMKRAEKQKKEEVKAAKDKAKADLMAVLEAEAARKKAESLAQSTVTPIAVADNTNITSE